MPARSARADSTTELVVEDLGSIDYQEAWDLQHDLANRRADDEIADRLLLLEHPFVFTAGRRTEDQDRPADGSRVIDVDRGGKITWHGPGQLVGYPIIKLASPVDVVDYVRRIEQALIEVCRALGLTVGRIEGRSGVWLPATSGKPERKVAAIGIRVARGVALHGFALNCNNTLGGFDAIVPCGIPDAGVTTLSAELGRDVSIGEVHDAVVSAITRALNGDLAVADESLHEHTA